MLLWNGRLSESVKYKSVYAYLHRRETTRAAAIFLYFIIPIIVTVTVP